MIPASPPLFQKKMSLDQLFNSYLRGPTTQKKPTSKSCIRSEKLRYDNWPVSLSLEQAQLISVLIFLRVARAFLSWKAISMFASFFNQKLV